MASRKLVSNNLPEHADLKRLEFYFFDDNTIVCGLKSGSIKHTVLACAMRLTPGMSNFPVIHDAITVNANWLCTLYGLDGLQYITPSGDLYDYYNQYFHDLDEQEKLHAQN